jgi:hypothetical protein
MLAMGPARRLRSLLASLASVLGAGASALLVLVLGFLVIAFLISAISERHDDCLCQDGTRASGWAWGARSPESNCTELCRNAGGGKPLPPKLRRR